MHQKLKTILSGAIIVLAATTLSGCGTASTPAPAGKPTASETPKAEQPTYYMGDVVVKTDAAGEPVVITDDLGTYQKLTIDPEAKVMSLEASKLDATVAGEGFSDEDVLSAQRWLMTWMGEEFYDSIAADGTTGWDEWKRTKGLEVVAPEWVGFLDSTDTGPDGTERDRSAFIANNPDNGGPVLIRDGLPRLRNVTLSIESVEGMQFETRSMLVFRGSGTAEYRATDASLIEAYKRGNPGSSDEDAIAKYPALGDGADDNASALKVDYSYSVRKDADSGWFITGFLNDIVAGE